MIKVENEQRRLEQIMRDRTSKGTVKARSLPIVTSWPEPTLTALLRCAPLAWRSPIHTSSTDWNLSHIYLTLLQLLVCYGDSRPTLQSTMSC